MSNYFANLPAARIPRNALLDFSPINNAIDSNRQNALATRQLDMRQEEQTYQRGRDATQDARVAKQDSRADEQYFANAAKAYAERPENDPVRANWPKMLKAKHPNFAALGPEYLDPIKGPALVMAEAGQYLDPRDSRAKDLELQKTEAEIGKLNAQAANGGSEYGKPPMGYVFGPTGNLTPIPGGPGDKLTETESKDALFAERMLRSERDLDAVVPIDEAGKFTGYDPTTWRQAMFPDKGVAANLVNSKEWQQYQRAARESLSAVLRKDTGAAVTDEEFNTYFPTYFPIPGDSPEVVKQKKAARQAAASGLRGASSRAFDRMFPDYDNKNPTKKFTDRLSDQAAPKDEAEYRALPSGTRYVDPQGVARVKP